MRLISIVIPTYNEEKNIPLIYDGVVKTWKILINEYDYEIIFIIDGSTDNSTETLKKISDIDGKVKYIEFSRNFGKEMAVSAGIYHCMGDAAIIIDADLQHPPELIPKFIEKWNNGADTVVGIRKNSKKTKLIKKIGSALFYRAMEHIGETRLIPNETDYRLVDKKIIREFNRFTERNRISRGLFDWLGFKKDYVCFDANERKNGTAGYDNLKLIQLALSTFVSHSLFPLKFSGYLGIFITFSSGILGFFIFIEKYILNDPWKMGFSGTAILALIILFLIGIVLSCLGLIALYIANINTEVVNRPIYVIREKKGF